MAAAGAAVCVLVVGCGSGSSQRSTTADAYLAQLFGDASQADSTKAAVDLWRAQQSALADCMRLAGFNYTPVAYSGEPTEITTDFTSAAYAQKYGFGIAVHYVEALGPPQPAVPADPNQAYAASLSSSGQTSYYGAYNNCLATATATARTQLGWTQIDQLFNDTNARMAADPVVVAAQTKWSECAAAKGYRFDSRLALINSIETRIKPFAALGVGSGSSAIPAEARAIQADEIKAAVATLPCSRDLDAARREAFQRLRTDTTTSTA